MYWLFPFVRYYSECRERVEKIRYNFFPWRLNPRGRNIFRLFTSWHSSLSSKATGNMWLPCSLLVWSISLSTSLVTTLYPSHSFCVKWTVLCASSSTLWTPGQESCFTHFGIPEGSWHNAVCIKQDLATGGWVGRRMGYSNLNLQPSGRRHEIKT